jgi:Ubiquitin family
MTRAMSESAATTMASTSVQTEDWCISIKTVGGGFDDDDHDEESNNATTSTNNSKLSSSSGERLFQVTVSPEDGVASLYQEIEDATGVKPSQQRLIYRGRIINDHPPLNGHDEEELDSRSSPKDLDIDATEGGESTNSAVVATSSKNAIANNNDPRRRKIKDIVGLCDGQTIHLVKKRETSNNSSPSSRSSTSSTNGQSSVFEAAAADLLSGSTSSGGGNGGGAFLAALLGLGNLSEDGLESNGNGSGNGDGTENTASAIPATSSWRSSRRSRRRPPYRLSAADLEVRDPGSMEPVRQGLMTLHTLLPHSELHRENGTSPLEANREWFRGQWLDCRDTVNQWLEATVVEIIRPRDILPLDAVAAASRSTNSSSASSIQRRQPVVDNDPAVSASDLEGRRRLLLEPCQPGDPLELSGDMLGHRPRSNNNGVQLLLIHYNGWPHRWDEWM